jgi:arginyl-tRNA synthetase
MTIQSPYQKLATILQNTFERAGWGELDAAAAQSSISFCEIEFGDFASNLALSQAKQLSKSPREIADAFVAILSENEEILSAEVAGPGFINVRLAKSVWADYANDLSKDFFRRPSTGKKVNVEFVSANPTGPLVLVNAWGGYYGDVLANIYDSQGWAVTREYYLNNGGNQIAQLGRAVQQAAGKTFTEEESAELYRGPYIDTLAAEMIADRGSTQAVCEAEPQEVGDVAQERIFESLIKPTLKRLQIQFDVVTPETTLDNPRTLERLRKAGAIIEEDGATWLSGATAGLEQNEVLVRSYDKQETYFLKDITYQASKLEERGFDRAITIVGPDHHGQEKRLLAALAALGIDGFVPLWTQAVRLIKDGEEFKMSKRRGNYIVLDDFLEKVPSDTARFFFAMRDPSSHFDLDLDVVTAQNKHNPLFYVMYAYVRSQSVLAKAETKAGRVSAELLDQVEVNLFRTIIDLDQKIANAISSHQVNSVLHGFIGLASLYHDWYEQHPILKAESDELLAHRLALVTQYATVCRGLFELIGITPLENM